MTQRLMVGAVAYDQKVVPDLGRHPRVLPRRARSRWISSCSPNYEAQVEALLAGRIDIAWNTNLAYVRAHPRDARRMPGPRDARYRRGVLHDRSSDGPGRSRRVEDVCGAGRSRSAARTRRRRRSCPSTTWRTGSRDLATTSSCSGSTPTSASTATRAAASARPWRRCSTDAPMPPRWGRPLGRLRAAGEVPPGEAGAVLDVAAVRALQLHRDAVAGRRGRGRVDDAPARDGLGEQPEHRRILELEGLREWLGPQLDGYRDLFAAVEEQGIGLDGVGGSRTTSPSAPSTPRTSTSPRTGVRAGRVPVRHRARRDRSSSPARTPAGPRAPGVVPRHRPRAGGERARWGPHVYRIRRGRPCGADVQGPARLGYPGAVPHRRRRVRHDGLAHRQGGADPRRCGSRDGVLARAAPWWRRARHAFPFTVTERDRVWANNVASLYEQATGVPVGRLARHPRGTTCRSCPIHVERAVCQIMTHLAENEYAALYVPAKLHPADPPALHRGRAVPVDPGHRRGAPHRGVHEAGAGQRRRSRSTRRRRRRRRCVRSSSRRTSRRPRSSCPSSARARSSSTSSFIERYAPDPVTADIVRRARVDEARHVAFGVEHARHFLAADPDRGEVLRASRRTAGVVPGRRVRLQPACGGSARRARGRAGILGGSRWATACEPSAISTGRCTGGGCGVSAQLGFDDDTAEQISELHTANFM